MKALIHTLHPVRAPDEVADADGYSWTSYCHSLDDPHEFGAVRSTIGHPFLLAENLVHEAAHLKLFALGIRKDDCDRLIENSGDELFKSPVIEYRARPMTALVHAIIRRTGTGGPLAYHPTPVGLQSEEFPDV